jgi:pyridoxine 4-dehydrogenase
MKPSHLSASVSGTFLIGGDLPVHRLGYGTMRLVGEGAWGEPADEAECAPRAAPRRRAWRHAH